MNAPLDRRVRVRAGNRCEYCKVPAESSEFTFPVDHIIAQQHGGETTNENLALSCPHDNFHKGPNIAGRDASAGVGAGRPRAGRDSDWPRLRLAMTPTGPRRPTCQRFMK